MARKIAPVAAPETDPQEAAVGQIKDAIAVRAARLEERFPKAVDLAARALHAMRGHLMGVASILCGTHSADHWRESLRGERSLKLDDVCRLAVSDRPEAGRAVEALIEVLADARGLALTPKGLRHSDPCETGARVAQVSAAAVAAIFEALQNDGKIDSLEAIALRPHVRALREALLAVEGLAVSEELGQ